MLQQRDTLRTADDVLGQQGGHGHGWVLFVAVDVEVGR
jgi:hypothetical protein